MGYHLESGVRLKLDIQSQGSGRILDVDGQGGLGVLKIEQFSWTSYEYHPYVVNLRETQRTSKLNINPPKNDLNDIVLV